MNSGEVRIVDNVVALPSSRLAEPDDCINI
jgi:hypothetical protein